MVFSQDLGVHGLLLKGDSVLLLKANGLWDLPGGGVGEGETVREAFSREVKEQTGLTVENVKILGAYTVDDGSLGLVVCGMVSSDLVQLSPAYSESQWLNIAAVQTLTMASLHLRAAARILFGSSRVVKFEEVRM
jgi:8-oxo-dGTP pyrophosphatase MutT (NUDIX family)